MATNLSPACQLALLPRAERDAFLASCTPEELAALEYDWTGFWAGRTNSRPWGLESLAHSQRPGVGENTVGAEQVLRWARTPHQRIALVAETAADVRDVLVEGEVGHPGLFPPWCMPAINRPKGA